jgi:hypothetical protein
VESCVAVLFVTLDTGANAATPAYEAHELEAGAVDVLDADDRFEEDRVGEVNLGDPNGAHDVNPLASIGLFVRACLVIRTKDALDWC